MGNEAKQKHETRGEVEAVREQPVAVMSEARILELFRQAVHEELGPQKPMMLTLAEAAKALRTSVATVRRMTATGALLTVRVGVGAGSPRVPISELRRLEVRHAPPPPKGRAPVRRGRLSASVEAARIRALAKPRHAAQLGQGGQP
jgi:hypothetical protein